jgi:hypothetical protein
VHRSRATCRMRGDRQRGESTFPRGRRAVDRTGGSQWPYQGDRCPWQCGISGHTHDPGVVLTHSAVAMTDGAGCLADLEPCVNTTSCSVRSPRSSLPGERWKPRQPPGSVRSPLRLLRLGRRCGQRLLPGWGGKRRTSPWPPCSVRGTPSRMTQTTTSSCSTGRSTGYPLCTRPTTTSVPRL